MSMAEHEVREISEATEYRINGKSYEDLIDEQDRAIERAAKQGRRQATFRVHGSIYDEFEERMRKHYSNLGYTFKPTGYIGGVLQQTMDICW